MCYLCLQGDNNPFGIKSMSRDNLESKKDRARLVKEILKSYELGSLCDKGQLEINKLKEEQYQLSKEI